MTKQRMEWSAPPEFPGAGATLFLDDLEEIARIFREFQLKLAGDAPNPDNLEPVTYRVDDWSCDSINDLKELGDYKSMVEVRLEQRNSSFTFYHIRRAPSFAGWITGSGSADTDWAFYGKVRELIQKRTPRWSLRRRARVIFQTSFEYKSLSSVLKRHGSQIAVAVITAVVTLLATEGVKWLLPKH